MLNCSYLTFKRLNWCPGPTIVLSWLKNRVLILEQNLRIESHRSGYWGIGPGIFYLCGKFLGSQWVYILQE